jgi:thymidylate synthase (FAD)
MRIVDPSAELLFVTPNGAELVELAGRVCYKSEDRITPTSAAAFVKMLGERGHASVIEHSYATVRIITDRGITHEVVRHRLASYSQESTRYCNYTKGKFGKEITVLQPSGLPPAALEVWLRAMHEDDVNYADMIAAGATPQQARSVLPTCLKTEIVMTANFREWLHFLKLRTAPAAHPDMQIVAKLIGALLHAACPAIFTEGYPNG